MTYIERSTSPQEFDRVLLLTDDQELERQLNDARDRAGLDLEFVLDRPGDGDAACSMTFLDLDRDNALEASLGEVVGPVVLLLSENSLHRLTDAIAERSKLWLKKPVSRDELRLALRQVRGPRPVETLYGSSPEIQGVRKRVAQAARAGTHVSVCGEAGVGKRIVARMIHRSSPRAGRPFLQISCAGFSEAVLSELLFGTPDASGAEGGGYLARAAGGTLLIDDIDLLPKAAQARLLAFLGGAGARSIPTAEEPVLIGLSNRPIADPEHSGAFLDDLREVLDHARIEIPPLRERKTDIPILADHFVRAASGRGTHARTGIDASALAELMRYDWPGNVRELRDTLEHARRGSNGSQLGVSDLPALPEVDRGAGTGPHIPGSTIHEIEKDAILRTLEATGGSTSQAARILEMSVRKIQYKLKEYRTGSNTIATESRPSVAVNRRPEAGRKVLVAGAGTHLD